MKKIFFTLVALTTIITSCKKGDTGPAGADAGAVVLAKVTISPDEWFYANGGYGIDVPADQVTQDIIDKAATIGYVAAADGIWRQLPYTYPGRMSIQYALTKGHILLGINYAIDTFGTLTFKIIAVPPAGKRVSQDRAVYLNEDPAQIHIPVTLPVNK